MAQLLPLVGGEMEPPTLSQTEIGNIITRYRNERLNLLPANDSTSVWISKERLDALFAANPDAEGLRLYFGVVDDPFTESGIHNVVLICTNEMRNDMAGDTDTVMVPKNYEVIGMGALSTAICPPPVDRCQGRLF